MIERLKRRMFWLVSRICFTLYGWFPLFGTLRASLGVIQGDGKFLVIRRNDGRGLCLPGGISSWREAEEKTLCREVLEETGLSVSGKELKLKYFCPVDFPCDVSVFEVQVQGEVRASWEGSPQWMTVAELEPHFVESQRPALDLLRKLSNDAQILPGSR